MAILIIEQPGRRQAGILGQRVLIGRWSRNAIVINDRAVSRIHAWIGMKDGRHYIADGHSRTGTAVNGEPFTDRRTLNDGDEIRIGPALIRYQLDLSPPVDCDPIDLAAIPAGHPSSEGGVFLDCECDAPLWVPTGYSRNATCVYCGRPITLPQAKTPAPAPRRVGKSSKSALPGTAAAPELPAAAIPAPNPLAEAENDAMLDALLDSLPSEPLAPGEAQGSVAGMLVMGAAVASSRTSKPQSSFSGSSKEQICGVCHASIALFEDSTRCPQCRTHFHEECWLENLGCSSFGCSKVGSLAKKG